MSAGEFSRLEKIIGGILRFGVAACAILLALGLALWSFGVAGAPHVINAGLAFLMGVPISRILASFADALMRRDRLLAWSTGAVLAILTLTIAYSLWMA